MDIRDTHHRYIYRQDSDHMALRELDPDPDTVLDEIRNGTDRLADLREELGPEHDGTVSDSLITLAEQGKVAIFPVGDVVKLRLDD
jgi:hypothetical protein